MLKNKCLALLAASVLLFTGCASDDLLLPGAADLQIMTGKETSYRTATVSVGDYGKSKSASGSLYFPDTVSLICRDSGARLEEILVSAGDEVKEGDVIATFTTPASATDLEEQRLAYSRKQTEVNGQIARWEEKIADKKLEIASSEGDKALLEIELDLLESQYAQYCYEANKSLAAMEKKVADLTEDLKVKELVAPFDGVIKSIAFLKKGDEAFGKEIAVIYDPENFLVKIEDTSGLFRYNTSVTVRAGSRNNPVNYEGTVVSSDDILSFPMQYTYIRVEDEGVTEKELSQNNLTVLTNASALEGVLMVPRAAVVNENGKRYVSILSEDGSVHKRYIVVGEMNNETVVVLDGLTEGQTVILY